MYATRVIIVILLCFTVFVVILIAVIMGWHEVSRKGAATQKKQRTCGQLPLTSNSLVSSHVWHPRMGS